MSAADVENARMLAHALGLSPDDAAQVLDHHVVVTAAASGESLARAIASLLSKSVRSVSGTSAPTDTALEIVVWPAQPRTSAARVSVVVREDGAAVGQQAEIPTSGSAAKIHPVLERLVACYACAAAVRVMTGAAFNMPYRDPARIDFGSLLAGDASILSSRTDIGVAFLAGVGAVGTHFIRALSTFDVRGELHAVDPDDVSDGNLNRCDFFDEADVGLPKVDRLVAGASALLPNVLISPHPKRLDELRKSGPWLEQLILAADSRRARRGLQEELPRDVYPTTAFAQAPSLSI